MPSGRPPLDAETKARNRKESLQRYAAKSASQDLILQYSLRLAAQERMKFKQFGRHRDKIREADTLRRAKSYITAHGAEAFDEKKEVLTSLKHRNGTKDVRLRKPRPNQGSALVPHRPRYNPHEVLTENQKRCRALRQCGLEEDNGEDSDADLPPGICGCDRTECQRMHKNETKDHNDWKIFH
ncbi:hypothetical protein B0H13DRAFT_1864548 [Mycena leptocephala]|nr:hypothetical protein B0H13DRAFT_1864548 [Mycena leptocephala]